jgi:hypothetical protein
MWGTSLDSEQQSHFIPILPDHVTTSVICTPISVILTRTSMVLIHKNVISTWKLRFPQARSCVISIRSLDFIHSQVWFWHTRERLRQAHVWFIHAECYSIRRMCVLHAGYDLDTHSVIFICKMRFLQEKCDFYMNEYDFYKQSVISIWISVISTRMSAIFTCKVWFWHARV